MALLPTVSSVAAGVQVAEPAVRVTVQRVVLLLSVNVTVPPEGVGPPVVSDTIAVNVTCVPNAIVLVPDVSARLVLVPLSTVCEIDEEVEVAKLVVAA